MQVPFMILRDPPGDESTTVWSKGSSTSVELAVSIGSAEAGHTSGGGGLAMGMDSSAAPGFSWGGHLEMEVPILSVAGGFIASNADDREMGKVRSNGNTLTLAAEVTYETSAEATETGLGADLIVTPSLSIRTVKNQPITFDAQQCEGVLASLQTTWQMIDPSNDKWKDMNVLLTEYKMQNGLDQLPAIFDVKSPNAAGLTIRQQLVKQARRAIESESWNAITFHSVFDIVKYRIPQLQARCLEERDRLWCDTTYMAGPVSALSSKEDIVTHCGIATRCAGTGNVGSARCSDEKDAFGPAPQTASAYGAGGSCTTQIAHCNAAGLCFCKDGGSDCDASVERTLAELRMTAALMAIKGWKRAIGLNEDLKKQVK